MLPLDDFRTKHFLLGVLVSSKITGFGVQLAHSSSGVQLAHSSSGVQLAH